MEHAPDAPAIVEFGRFRVVPNRRELLAEGRPIKLGGRDFDLLMALIEVPGAVVSKDALMDRVWVGRIVEENRLQGAIAALRRAFGADRGLIRTVAGRGYQFIGDIRMRSAADSEGAGPGTTVTSARPVHGLTNLHEPVSELIGREAELAEVVDLLTTQRLVTLIGEGGIGKTRLGLETVRHLLPEFPDGVWVAELAPLSDPELVPATVATALGLELAAGVMSAEHVANALGAKQLMLVLDNCEHVIDAAAGMAEAVLHASSAVRVLATSREPLRIEVSRSTGCHLWQCPPKATRTRKDCCVTVRFDCLSRVPAQRIRTSHWAGLLRPSWPESAGGSTAFRWRSSWRRHAAACSGFRKLQPGSMIGSTCSAAVTERHCRGTRPCWRRSIGATTCSPSLSGRCCGAWLFLPAPLR